jgi:hypothetical protein
LGQKVRRARLLPDALLNESFGLRIPWRWLTFDLAEASEQ